MQIISLEAVVALAKRFIRWQSYPELNATCYVRVRSIPFKEYVSDA